MPVSGQFYTNIAGVSFDNEDGSNRQSILRECKTGEKLILTHYPIPEDINAVKVTRLNGQQIGWLNKLNAREIAPYLDRGESVEAEITSLGNSKIGKPIWCNILITKPEAQAEILKQTAKRGKRIVGCLIAGVITLVIIITLLALNC